MKRCLVILLFSFAAFAGGYPDREAGVVTGITGLETSFNEVPKSIIHIVQDPPLSTKCHKILW